MAFIKPTAAALLLILAGTLLGCGGSGGGETAVTPPTIATRTIKLSTAGTPSIPISGIELIVTLPAGVTVNADLVTGQVAPSALSAIGVAPSGSMVVGKYTPAGNTVKLALITTATFGVGDFVQLLVNVPADSTFTAADFGISAAKIVGVGGDTVTGLTLEKAVTLQ